MKILFVMDRRVNAGSIQAVANYVSAGDECGHTVALYGRPDTRFERVRFSTDVESFDYVVFILESGLFWLSGLRMPRILRSVPRERRAILDADGMYNDRISVDGYDRNHATEAEGRVWAQHCELLADKVFQPTYQPLKPKVVGLPFYGYNPRLSIDPGGATPKSFDIVHVAHNWWRWKQVSSDFLPALESIRSAVDGVCFVGSWWDGPPPALDPGLGVAFQAEPGQFRRLRIQIKPPVPFTEVMSAMSQGRINIMTQRPLFRHLGLLTSKYFEIFCADTIPLVMLDADHAESVYGPAGRELALDGAVGDKLLDALRRPKRYREIVEAVRCYLAEHHSYRQRIQELVAALSAPGQGGVGPCA